MKMFVIRANNCLKLRAAIGLRNTLNGSSARLYSSSDKRDDDGGASSSDDESNKPRKSKKAPQKPESSIAASKESATVRLNRLLASMKTDDNFARRAIDMAKPGEANRKRKEANKQSAANKDVFQAAKRVADLMGVDESSKKQTESELLSKLLGNDKSSSTAAENQTGEAAEISLAELIGGMKVDRSQPPKEPNRADFVRQTLARSKGQQNFKKNKNQKYSKDSPRKREAESFTGSVNLFGGEGLGIFKDPSNLQHSEELLSTWSKLEQHDLKLFVTHPAKNYFEKLARWTEKNKVWHFPIDNEQGLPEEEVNVHFSEHIFLDQHLEPWCPERGPIRHFMELVCVGLSKNYHLSAKEKREHIFWYRDYFESKRDMLKDLMNKDKMNQAALSSGEQLEA